jgi:transposase InsO family protein
MSWQEVTRLSLRIQFVRQVLSDEIGFSETCRRFKISRKTGYKWLNAYRERGPEGLPDRSRRPRRSPNKTASEVEQLIVDLRKQHPAWGGRKLKSRLENLGHCDIPQPSTVTEILRRNGLLDPAESEKHGAWQRFESEQPNHLWQMDFKGHFATDSGRCHPLTILDDHSRYSISLQACSNEQGETVKSHLIKAFEIHGLPLRMLMDNGAPWFGSADHRDTPLTLWLMRLGIVVRHGRPYHPQTQGKDERFHKTLMAEVLRHQHFMGNEQCQRRFDEWREIYNHQRPHEALDMKTPASRYRPSPRPYSSVLPAIEYGPSDIVRKVTDKGIVFYKGRTYKVGRAYEGYPVGLRPTVTDGLFDVYFCHQKITVINIAASEKEG